MELLRTWILSVTASALVIAGADALMPPGAVKRVGKLTGGLILVLCLLQPLSDLEYGELYAFVSALPVGELSRETLEDRGTDTLEELIEEELSAYIAEKGAALGCVCTARVDCIPDEDGVPIPCRVEVTGNLTPEQKRDLQACITRDLGIGPEDQQYTGEVLP